MSKIDEKFSYDLYKAILSSRRSELLERFIGIRGLAHDTSSMQGVFEQTQSNINLLPTLQDPDGPKTQLRLLAWQLGWDDSKALAFLNEATDAVLRRVLAFSSLIWTLKGSDKGLIGAVQAFTGKRSLIFNWFYHRLVLDEAGLWLEGTASDPFLVGGTYTDEDEDLFHLIVNREGFTNLERKILYDLLTYIRVAGEHCAIIYAAFVDNFGGGLSQWEQLGTADAVYIEADRQLELPEDSKIRTRTTLEEAATWSPSQQVRTKVSFSTNTANEVLTIESFRDDIAGTNKYEFVLTADGQASIVKGGVTYASSTAVGLVPLPGYYFNYSAVVTAINAGEVSCSLWVNNEKVVEHVFIGLNALDNSSGGAAISRTGNEPTSTIVKQVIVLASPFRVQYVGQKALDPTVGPFGTEYIADPDPGLEPFIG